MKKSDYYLMISRGFDNKRIYYLIKDHDLCNCYFFSTYNKYEIKLKIDIMGLEFKCYKIFNNGHVICAYIWFK